MARRAATDRVSELVKNFSAELGRVVAESVQRELEASISVSGMARRLGAGARRGRKSSDASSCSEPGCNNPVLAKGLCRSHYYRARYRSQKGGGARGKRAGKAAAPKKRAKKPAPKAPEAQAAVPAAETPST